MSQQRSREEEKRRAAVEASGLVKDGQIIGLGTGSTADYMIEELGRRIREEGLRVKGVPTSKASAAQAEKQGVPLTSLDEYPELDIDIDGADQVDQCLNLIKGMGGALTREKVVAAASRMFVVVVDAGKLAKHLGEAQVLPIEVVPFALPTVQRRIIGLGGKPKLRTSRNGEPFVSDNGNVILDADFGVITEAEKLGASIKMIPGVVEDGLFIGMASAVYVGFHDRVDKIFRETLGETR
jgi:ribose 5-phosphate isomerase A